MTVDRDDPNGLKLYADGVSETFNPTGYQQSLTNDGDLEMGVDTYISGNRFSGELDEVELFNRALTDIEIQAIFEAGAAGKCKPEPRWDCERADLYQDGIVNFKDLAIIANCWLETCP